MALEDYMQPEVAVAAVVTAAVFSPRTRRVMRRGLVYGMAGAMIAGDAIASFARSLGQGVQEAGASAASATQSAKNQAKAEATETATDQTKTPAD